MKKRQIKKIIPIVLVVVLLIGAILILSPKKFYLGDEYYNGVKVEEIELVTLKSLIEKKISFALLVYQEEQEESANFMEMVMSFQRQKGLSFYKIPYAQVENSDVGIASSPAVVLYKNGSQKDTFKSATATTQEFSKWFTKKVKMKKGNNTNVDDKEEDANVITDVYDIEPDPNAPDVDEMALANEVSLQDIARNHGKVNVYLFWGDGCPHCSKELQFLDSIKSVIGDKFVLYTFETWKNAENVGIMNQFAEAMGDNVTGVPYTIIGNTTINGFTEAKSLEMVDAIEDEVNRTFDVYFDKVKSN